MKIVVLVSYWSGTPGVVTSEWVKDKLKAFEDMGTRVVLVTSAISSEWSTASKKVVKLPSLSKVDFDYETELGWGTKSLSLIHISEPTRPY